MKGLMKMFFIDLTILKEWKMIRLLKGCNVGKCMVSYLLGRPQKRWIDSVNDWLKKRGLNVEQARRMVYDRNEWHGLVRGNAGDIACGMNPVF